MKEAEQWALIAILVVSFGVFFVFVLWRLFRQGSRGNVPTFDEVEESVAALDVGSKRQIDELIAQFTPRLSKERFSLLCVASTMSIEAPLVKLGERFLFTDFLDSLNMVEFIMLLEELFRIEIPDEDAERLRSFREVSDYVGSKVSA